jgi:DNA invertase Pin-like site-specific DNA recombinase
MKAAGYLRVSTDAQAGEDRFGLESQTQAIQKFAEDQGYELTTWYTDAGVSGGTLERPELQRLLQDSPAGEFEVVLVAKMDRVARDLMAQLWLEKELLRADVEIISVAEPFRGQDATNRLFRQIIGAFAEFEKSRITDRMSSGRKVKASRGGYAGGGVPLGYKSKRGSGRIEVDQSKVDVVRAVFRLKERGLNLQEVTDELNRQGLLTALGCRFHRTQVRRILLHQEYYAGTYQYAGTFKLVGEHLPILPTANECCGSQQDSQVVSGETT